MMEQLTDHHYDVLSVSEDIAANCVYARGPAKVDFLLHPTAEECPNSTPVSDQSPVHSVFKLHAAQKCTASTHRTFY